MAPVVKRLRPRIVVPICMGSNPIRRPILSVSLFLNLGMCMSRLSERIENFNRAFLIFSNAVAAYNKNREDILTHMALVQSFEVSFELA